MALAWAIRYARRMGWPIPRWPRGLALLLIAATALACGSESDPSRGPDRVLHVVIPAEVDFAWFRDPEAGPRPVEVPLPDEDGRALKVVRCAGEVLGVFLDTLDLQLHTDPSPAPDGFLRPQLGQVFVAGEGDRIIIPSQAAHLFLACASESPQEVAIDLGFTEKPPPETPPSVERMIFVRWTGTEFDEVEPSALQDGVPFRVEVRYDKEPVEEQVLVRLTWDDGPGEQVLVHRSLLEPTVFRSEELTVERIGDDR